MASRTTHVSLSRPYGTFVDSLPEDAVITSGASPWERITHALVQNPGEWMKLQRAYRSNPSSPTHSARKALEQNYPEHIAAGLQVASVPCQKDSEFVEVYMRVNLEDDDGE